MAGDGPHGATPYRGNETRTARHRAAFLRMEDKKRRCAIVDCPLWPWRTGRRPRNAGKTLYGVSSDAIGVGEG